MRFIILFILSLFVSCTVQAQAPTNGLIAYYPFNGNANDSSGNNRHGTISGNPTFEAASRQAIHLVGNSATYSSAGDHVLLPNINFNSMSAFTISMWVKDEELLNSSSEAYIWYGEHVSGAIGITNFYNELIFFVGTTMIRIPYNEADRGKFIKLSLIYDNQTMSAYKNNVLIGRKTNVTFNIRDNTAAIARHWWIEANGTNGTSTRFKGSIDEVRIYNRALSYEELTNIVDLPVLGAIKLYPNPVNDWLTVTYTSFIKQLSIVNELGQTVKIIEGSQKDPVKINVADLTKGLYFVRINGESMMKFIKL
jgi:Concanavalin A-like lectin/glucanases superfamily/Secretion system C-terminal sorting domain